MPGAKYVLIKDNAKDQKYVWILVLESGLEMCVKWIRCCDFAAVEFEGLYLLPWSDWVTLRPTRALYDHMFVAFLHFSMNALLT